MIGRRGQQVKNQPNYQALARVSPAPPLILASTSPYRRELLARLRIPFTVRRPEVDETGLPGEEPRQRAERLAFAKAQAIAAHEGGSVVIGADQVAACEGVVLGKPGDAATARAQLLRQSGRAVVYYSAVAVVCGERGFAERFVNLTTVRLRKLEAREIDAYIEADRPYDCAGSLRSEALGPSLCERIESEDPTGLIGLPLIRLAASLRSCGYALP
jgi:7-methyl-GTP pyrophosphatase